MTTPDPKAAFSGQSPQDEVIKDMSRWLGLKVVAIRGWSVPQTYKDAEKAVNDLQNSVNDWPGRQKYHDDIRARFAEQEKLTLESLRAALQGRDSQTANDLTDNDLRSLLKVRHVTLRAANTEPPHTVIVFDPLEAGETLDRKWAVNKLLADRALNPWQQDEKSQARPLDFLENLDIEPLDFYAYETLMRVHYALRHQNEFVNINRSTPHFPIFAGIKQYDQPRVEARYASSLSESYEIIKAEIASQNYIYDKGDQKGKWPPRGFYDSVTRLQAIGSLIEGGFLIPPLLALARLAADSSGGYAHSRYCSKETVHPSQINDDEAKKIQENLRERLHAVFNRERGLPEEHKDITNLFAAMDPRTLFPAFREVYEQDQSTGPQRAYMDFVMHGLQRYFPTLTNGAVPSLNPEKEPPRTLEGYKKFRPPQPPSPLGPA